MSPMANHEFSNARLWITPRSPFARRVRLAFLENDVPFEEKVCDIFNPSKEILDLNPLGRVPLVELKSGSVLVDSNLILQAFYEGKSCPLYPSDGPTRYEMHRWSGIFSGLAEKIVEFYLNTLRPKNLRDTEFAEDLNEIMGRVMTKLESTLATKQWVAGQQLSQADLDGACALSYLSLRYSTEWRHRYTRVAEYLDRLEERPAFQKTKPPAA